MGLKISLTESGLSTGDKKIDGVIERAVNLRHPIKPMTADVGSSVDAGVLDAKVITAVIEAGAGVETIVDHPLRRVPTLVIPFIHDGVIPDARIYLNTAQNITSAGWEKILFDAESFPSDEVVIADSRLTAKIAGPRLIVSRASFGGVATTEGYEELAIYVNGAVYSYGNKLQRAKVIGAATVDLDDTDGPIVSDIVYLNVDDYVEIYARQNFVAASALTIGAANTYMLVIGRTIEVKKGSTLTDTQIGLRCSHDTTGNPVTVEVLIA